MHEVITGDEVAVIILILVGNGICFYYVKQCFSYWKDLNWVEIALNFLLLAGMLLQLTFTVLAISNSHFYKTLVL